MSTVETHRVAVWLPVTTPIHRVAYKRALRRLDEDVFVCGSSNIRIIPRNGLGAEADERTSDKSYDRAADIPVCHGWYVVPGMPKEGDSHVVVIGHIPHARRFGPGGERVTEARLVCIERMIYDVYKRVFEAARRVDSVYQESIFVECWDACYVDISGREHPIRIGVDMATLQPR